MGFLKTIALAILITLGILWAIYVVGCGDYREPREVIADEQKLDDTIRAIIFDVNEIPETEPPLRCSRCWGYTRIPLVMAVHNCRNTGGHKDSLGQTKPELACGPEGYNPAGYSFDKYVYTDETPRIEIDGKKKKPN